MRLKTSFLVAIVFATTLCAADPTAGTWKISLDKSRLRDPVAWKGRIMIVEAAREDARRITFIDTGKDGQTTRREDVRTNDSKERPDKLNPGRTIMAERIDESTTRTTWKESGKVVQILVSSVSQDGKVMTNYVKGLDHKGSIYEEKRVFDRQ